MSESQTFVRLTRSSGYRYALAVLAVAVALAIKLILLHFRVTYPLSSSFLAAIAVAFWFGGTGPGILAVLLSSLAFGYIVVPDQLDLVGGGQPASFVTILPYLIYFVLLALLMSWFSSSRRKAERLLSQARSDLEAKVEGRTADLRQANQELQAEVAERREAEEALHEAHVELAHVSRVMTIGELVASIAHEVNQPLGAIVTNGQACLRLLSREAPDLVKSREVVQRMIRDGMRASEVIKRIRDLLHKTPAEKASLNINETIEEVIALISSEVLRSKVKLKTELGVDLAQVLGDRIQLQQVILNLILNAKDAMSGAQTNPRELQITSGKNNAGEVVVSVRDTGPGLEPKDLDRIFDAFFTTKAGGMGLGLSISRTIIEAHGGRLWATQNEDKGATIQFTLRPVQQE